MMEGNTIFFEKAFEVAFEGIRNNTGGPFGAVVVKDGIVIGTGCNQVTSSNDPTAHAEVTAIRNACRNVGSFDLTGAEIYATCEPCPMCLSAIYWANIGAVYYCSTRYDAAEIGFRDNHIYEELAVLPSERMIPFIQENHPLAVQLFREWREKSDKVPY